MKRLFTFAIVALMATLAFAQSQHAQRRVAYTQVQRAIQVGQLGPQAYAEALAKANAANEAGQSRLVRSTNPAAGYQQLSLTDGIALGKVAKPATTTRYSAPAKVTETDGNLTITKDANGIITAVEGGTTKYYTRATSGTAYYPSNGKTYPAAQSGTVTTVEDGNSVYILNPVTRYTTGAWVKGVKSGNAITVATYQPLNYNAQYNATISLRWGTFDAEGFMNAADSQGESFTYTVNGDVISLQGTQMLVNGEQTYFMGVFWDDDDSASGYGDAETVLTLNANYTPPSTDLVELPAGVTAEGWYLNGANVTSSGETAIKNQNVNVAFDGNDVYVQGIFVDFPNSWIKGTKNGNTYKFEKFQFIGTYGSYNIWVVGLDANEGLSDFTATFDATENTLTFAEPVLANAADDRVYYLDWYQDVVLSADEVAYEEPILNELTATLPYVNSFDTEEEQAQVAIYDANDDSKTFKFEKDSNSGSTAAKYTYSSSNVADDYLVFPAVQLEAGKTYIISVDARANSNTFAEKVSVICGTESKLSAMTIEVIPTTTLVGTEYSTLTNGEFKVTETAMYSFAVKACSDKNMFYLYVDNFSIKEANSNAPAAPADLTVTPDATGANKATVTLTAPSKNLAGATLQGVLDMVIKVDGEQAVAKTVTAGAAVSEEITVDAPGTYKVSVEFSCAAGVADPVTVSAYIGIDIPTQVTDLNMVDKSTAVGMSWVAPQVGKNGGVFFPDQLTYNVYPVEWIEFLGMTFPSIDYDNPLSTGITGVTYDMPYNCNEGEMGYTYFAVGAVNEAGEGTGLIDAVVTGAPISLPVKESVAGNALANWWATSCDDYNYKNDGGLYFGEDSSDGDGSCFMFNAVAPGWMTLESAKIALDGAANPVAQFDVYGAGSLEVYVITPAGETLVQAITPTSEWTPYTVSLVEYKDADWVRVILKGVFDAAGQMYMDNIKIFNLLDHNLVVTGLNAPAKVNAGTDIVATVTVENQGSLAVAAADYTVKFTVNGEETVLEGVDLAPNAKAEFAYTLATSVVSEDAYAIKAEAVYAADEDQANNTSAEVTVKVAFPNFPTVADLTAKANGNAVNLAWQEPDLENIAPEPVTDDLEGYEPFQFGDAIGEWTLVDVDQVPMGGVQNMDFPNLTPEVTLGSFFVFNQEVVAGNESFATNSGVQCLMTMFAYDSETFNNDWIISPALCGEAQTISFYAKTYTATYGLEKINVLYSTTDTNLESFVAVNGDTPVDVAAAWTEYSFDLPEGAKYFAIQCVSEQAFMLMVDDITYIPANGATADLEIVGYNVYRDGVKVNAEPVAETTYTDADLADDTTYTYAVSVVYTQGESKAVVADAVTGIESIDAEAGNATYYNMQGVQVAKPAAGTTAIRVVNGKATKVIIR